MKEHIIRIKPSHNWNNLDLPQEVIEKLRDFVAQTAQEIKLSASIKLTGDKIENTGIIALFSGPFGTGKTMAAEILAKELELDLYRIDLSQIVSNYIGETEKNLSEIFNEAENKNWILFFDEADALFGKRNEVKDSHDRYANIELTYLLKRLEDYIGIAIISTNMKSNIESPFLRRLRYEIDFPYPDIRERINIWGKMCKYIKRKINRE